MLRLLADSETAIRRSANPRLIVETCCSGGPCWTGSWIWRRCSARGAGLAGRTGGSPAAEAQRRRPVRPPSGATGEHGSDGRNPAGSHPAARRRRRPRRRARRARTLAALARPSASPGPSIVAEVRARSRFLGEALAATDADRRSRLPWLTVELAEPNPLFAERLQAQARAVERSHGRSASRSRLRVTERAWAESAPAQPRASSPRPASRPTGCGGSGPRIRPSTRPPMR